jgi:flavorubredoxin
MLDFMMHLQMLNLNKRTGAIVYNGTWAPAAGKAMREFLTTSLKNWTVLDKEVKITSALDDVSNIQIKELAKAIAEDVNQ